MPKLSTVLYLFVALNTVDFVNCAKILVHGVTAKSHYLGLSTIAKELSSRGHEVILLMPSCLKFDPNNSLVKYYDGLPDELCLELNGTNPSPPQDLTKGGVFRIIRIFYESCKALLSSPVFEEVQDFGFDIQVAEIITPCSYVIATNLDIPFVGIGTGLSFPYTRNWIPTSYSSLSYVPYFLSGNPSTGMNFFQRVKNVLCYVGSTVLLPMTYNYYWNKMMQELDILPGKSIQDISLRADIVLIKGDVFEEAQPLPPDVKLIGPVFIKEAKPLTDEFEMIMKSSGNAGVIYISFGSTDKETSWTSVLQAIASAVARLPNKVIWKTKDNSSLTLGENTRTFTWVPQNDILGHPKTKVFITHAGLNSINEAMYHGVPMVSVPFFADQPDNSKRLVSRHMAIEVNPKRNKEEIEDQIFNSVTTIINDPSYKNKLLHYSRIFKSRRRTPVEEAGDWVEYVLKVKDMSHLKPVGRALPFYQLYMLDVIVFIVLALALVIFILAFLILLILRFLKKVFGKEEKSKSA